MRYGPAYGVVDCKAPPFIERFEEILSVISSNELEFNDSSVFKPGGKLKVDKSQRKNKVSFINDDKDDTCGRALYTLAQEANYNAAWNLKIDCIYPIQYGVYEEGDFYGWHMDQNIEFDPKSNESVKKISMSLFLNDPSEYEGGDLDIEYQGPASDPRYDSFRLPMGNAVFFQSDVWHRVRPVTSGIRKSLVAWFGGPAYT